MQIETIIDFGIEDLNLIMELLSYGLRVEFELRQAYHRLDDMISVRSLIGHSFYYNLLYTKIRMNNLLIKCFQIKNQALFSSQFLSFQRDTYSMLYHLFHILHSYYFQDLFPYPIHIYPLLQNQRMQITILNKPSQLTQHTGHNYLILGVHSFTHFLLELQHKKKVKVFIKGDLFAIAQNVLWNQFFTATFFKDCYRFLGLENGNQNSFVKVNGRTFKLKDTMEWENRMKFKQQFMRCGNFGIEGFLYDGSILTISVDCGENFIGNYDLIFRYEDQQPSTESIEPKSQSRSTNKKNKMITSHQQTAKKSMKNKSNQLNYESEKKQSKEKPFNPHFMSSNHMHGHVEPSTSVSKKTRKYNETCTYSKHSKMGKINRVQSEQLSDSQIEFIEECNRLRGQPPQPKSRKNKQKSIKCSNQPQLTFCNMSKSNTGSYKKQKIVEHLLLKKEEEVRNCKNIIEQNEQKYLENLHKNQKDHETEVLGLKNQVQLILEKYRSKNKDLKRENNCLNEANGQLLFINTKLEQQLAESQQKLSNQQKEQEKTKEQNRRNTAQIERLNSINKNLSEKLSQLDRTSNQQMSEKDRQVGEYRQKYEKLLGNIRKMALCASPMHQHTHQKNQEPLLQTDKQNMLF